MSDKTVPRPFGIPAWRGVKRRVAKKLINSRGRDLLRRYRELSSLKVGDLVRTCDGLNSHVTKVEPDYQVLRRGVVLLDLDIQTDRTSCSLYNCGVERPCSYKEAVDYRDQLVKGALATGDPWGFAERYSHENMTIHADGTYTRST